MGSTIITSLAVRTFVARPDGVQYIALFEQTYEANSHPHTPYWGCRFFGTYADAVRFIFRSAGVCEGGLLRSRSGPMRPERYIARWQDAMKNAAEQPDALVDVRFGTGMYELAPDKEDAIRAACVAHGLAIAVEVNAASGQPVRLRFRLSDLGGCALCAWLSSMASPCHVQAWRMLSGAPAAATAPSPVQLPATGPFAEPPGNGRTTEPGPPLAAYKLMVDAEGVHCDHLVVHQDRSVVIEWPYSHIETFTATVAAQAELQAIGAGAPLITSFRQRLVDAVLAPDPLRLKILREPLNCDLPHRAKEVFDRIASICSDHELGQFDDARQALTVTMGDLRACGAVQMLRQLQRRGQITCVADVLGATVDASATSGAAA